MNIHLIFIRIFIPLYFSMKVFILSPRIWIQDLLLQLQNAILVTKLKCFQYLILPRYSVSFGVHQPEMPIDQLRDFSSLNNIIYRQSSEQLIVTDTATKLPF